MRLTMAKLNEKSTKNLSKIDIWRIIRDNTTNKKVLVIHDFLTASIMARNNEVYYITDDEIKRNIFVRGVINNVNFGNNDKAELIKDWNKINEFINEKFGEDIMFDLIIGNPPYGKKKEKTYNIHYKIAEQLNKKFNEKMILIMPHRVLYSSSDTYNYFKKQFNNVSNIYEVDSEIFEDTQMPDIAIFVFENVIPKELVVTYKNNEVKTYENLLKINNIFNDYEMKFMVSLYNEKPNYNPYRPCNADKTVKFNKNFCSRFNRTDRYFVCSNLANGSMDGRFFPKKETTIIVSDIFKYLNESDYACKVISSFNTKIEATNYVNALNRPLMRFGLIKMQDDQNMTTRCYQYIPEIDWSDDKTKTDKGILELCGINKTEAAKFAKYCEDYIKNFDGSENTKTNVRLKTNTSCIKTTNLKIQSKNVPTKEQIKKLQIKGLNLVSQIKKKNVTKFGRAYGVEWRKINKKFSDNQTLRSYNYAKARIAVAKKFI